MAGEVSALGAAAAAALSAAGVGAVLFNKLFIKEGCASLRQCPSCTTGRSLQQAVVPCTR